MEELNKLGFRLDAASMNVENELYPHLVGHGVGIDLHESDGWRNEECVMTDRFWGRLLTSSFRLQAGHVVTIEPGVYVPADRRYPEEFHGIGIRIEVRQSTLEC
jgi:intermediate cleaving peptidase 55